METVYEGWVRHSNGQAYYQQAADNQWGFDLLDEEKSYPGGVDLGNGSWAPISESDLLPEEVARLKEGLLPD